MRNTYRWQVIEIDLENKLPHLDAADGYSGVRAIYRLKGRAVGHSDFTLSQLPLSPVQVAIAAAHRVAAAVGDRLLNEGFRSALCGLAEPELAHACETLDELIRTTQPLEKFQDAISTDATGELPSVAIAICTCKRPRELARCLESLAALTERPREIIVVDNAPEDGTTREVANRFRNVRYVAEPRPGLSAARNAALAAACSDIVAFTDDDVIVDSDWSARIRRGFADPQTMVVTGLILPAELETRAQLIFEKNLAYFHQGYRARKFDRAYFHALKNKGVHTWAIGAGANMAIRRRAFALGFRFDTRLGPGVFGGCGEDSEYWYRLLAGGWQCAYDPSAIVYHYHRRDLGSLRVQMKQYMKGHVASLILQYKTFGDRGNLRRLLVGLPAHYVLLLLRTIAGGLALEDRVELSGLIGAIAGLGFIFAPAEERR